MDVYEKVGAYAPNRVVPQKRSNSFCPSRDTETKAFFIGL